MYNDNELALIWLTMVEKMTSAKARAVLGLFECPAKLRECLESDAERIQKAVGSEIYLKMLASDERALKNYVKNLTKSGVRCVTIESENYPYKLFDLDEKPLVLFAKGNLALLEGPAVAIVGTRNPSAYGREVTREYATSLAKAGVVIVSGLASGVDKAAHEGALEVGGKTIAVLGGGFNSIYPAMNTNLAEEISKKGLLLSEYKPSVSATKYTFPARNRIIAALSDAVILTEAGQKSGAFYTKDFAKECGRAVYSVPSNITSSRGAGTNALIKNREAIMTTEPEDVLANLGVEKSEGLEPKPKMLAQVTMTEQQVLTALEDKSQTFEELMIATGLDAKNLNSCLTMMQIRGLIKKLPGNEFCL